MSRRSAHYIVVLVVVLGLLVPAGAHATFPGANGLIAFDDYDGDNVYVINPDGSGERALAIGGDPAWSPDGQLLAFRAFGTDGGISVMAADGSGQRLVVPSDGEAFDSGPTWTPDGAIIFSRSAFDNPAAMGLWRVGADGSGLTQLVNERAIDPEVSPDGTTIAYGGQEGDRSPILLVGIDGSNRRVLTDAPAADPGGLSPFHHSPSWAPDGSRLVFAEYEGFSQPSGPLMVVGVDGTGQRQLVDDGQYPSWSPDGTTIAFASGGASHLSLMNPDGSDLRVIRPFDQDTRSRAAYVAWQPVVEGAPPPPAPEQPFDLDVGDVKFDGDPATTERVDTPSPVAAALAIAQGRFVTAADGGGGAPGTVGTSFAQDQRLAAHVVLSRDDVFADSLAGAPLVGDGPIFFTDTQQLHSQTRAEIDRVLQPGGRLYVLGGTGAVSQGIEDELAAAGYEVVRLSGPSRVETSVRIGQEVRALYPGDRVALARAGGPEDNPTAAWADSITGGAWAAFAKIPVVVTPSEQVHPAIAEFLTAVQPSETILLGGTAALSAEVESAVPNPRRVAGPSRDETAVEIAEVLWEQVVSGERSYVMFNAFQADGWMFGLGAAGVAADAAAPLLPVNPAGASESVLGVVAKTDPDGPPMVDLLLFGDTSVIPDEVRAELDAQD